MKKLLILIVFAAVYLHFYPQKELTLWYNEQKSQLLEAFSQATDTKVRLKADKIYQDLKPKFVHFKTQEQKYLKSITQDRQSLLNFYNEFCVEAKPNAKLHANNQKLVCKTITKYQSLM